MESYVAHTGEKINAWRYLVGNHTGKNSFGRPRPKWWENMKMDLKEIR
jgi:hypothetical protein